MGFRSSGLLAFQLSWGGSLLEIMRQELPFPGELPKCFSRIQMTCLSLSFTSPTARRGKLSAGWWPCWQ